MSLPLLLPVLRSASQPALAWRVAARNPAHALLRRRVAPLLHCLLATEREGRLHYLGCHRLAELQLSPGAAWVAAWTALDPLAGLQRRPDGLWELASGDGLAASRLAIPRWLERVSTRCGGPLLAAVPHARQLLLGPAERADELLALAEQGWERAGSPISPALYAVENGELIAWREGAAASLAHRRLLVQEARVQREELGDLYEAHFAALRLDRGPPGGRTEALWPAGVDDPLLPVADRVRRPDGTRLSWAELRARYLLQPIPGLDPPRVQPRPLTAPSGPPAA